jgi:polysaccharide biosynthesis transport protein
MKVPQDAPFEPISALLHRWWVVPVCALVLGGTLASVYALLPERYTSTTVLLVQSATSDQDLPSLMSGLATGDTDRALNTQAEIIRSDAVVGSVAEEFGMTTEDVRRNLEVETREQTHVLVVAGTADDPELAQGFTAAVADAYATLVREEGRQQLLSGADALDDSIETLGARLDELATETAAQGDPRSAPYAAEIAALTREQDRLRTAAAVLDGYVSVLSAADLPLEPSSQRPVRGLVEGVGLGIVIGVLVALALDWSTPHTTSSSTRARSAPASAKSRRARVP